MILRRKFLLLFVLTFVGGTMRSAQENGGANRGKENAEGLTTLEGLVGKWTDLRTEIASERREWERSKTFWEKEIKLLETDIERLRASKAEVLAMSGSVEERQAELMAEKEKLQVTLNAFRPVLDRVESDLRLALARVPESLRSDLEDAEDRLPDSEAAAREMRVVDRVQAVATLLTALESLHTEPHVVRELLSIGEGRQRQVDVVYLGLARGFAVSGDETWAAVGIPGEEGWVWTPRPEWAEQVRGVISVHEQQEPARRVTLPLGVTP